MVKTNNNLITCDNLKASYIVVFLAAAVLYIATCAPGPLWQDSGIYQYRIWHNDIEGWLGLALSHPLYHIIGIGAKYIPLGEFAYRINLISAIAGAFTVANLFLLLRLWLNRNLPALLAAVTLALSHTLWRHAVIAEDYTLYTALLLAELLMLLQYVKTKRIVFLYMLGLFNGLAIATHMFASIGFICYLVFLMVLLAKKQLGLKHFAIIIAFWVAGAVPYEYLIIKNIIQTGNFSATIASALFGDNWQADVLNISLSGQIVSENLVIIAYNFSTFNGLFFFAGLYGLKKVSPSHSFANILLALLIFFFVFAFRYTVPDRYAFFMPFYCIGSVIGGVGFNLFVTQPRHKILRWIACILILLPIPTYIIAPAVAQKVQFELPVKRQLPYRNNYTWFLRPWKARYKGAEKFANEALGTVVPAAIIFADTTTVSPLLYVQQVKGKRKDVKIISIVVSSEDSPEFNEQTIEKLLTKRAVYVVSLGRYCPNFLLKRYDFVPEGILWRVVERQKK